MDKRGVAIPFDWIFSLVAGVLIFSFLIYFAVQHTDLFGKITTRVVAEELDVLFSGYETTESKSVLDFKKEVELEFKCDDGRQRFTINNKEGKNLWGKIIFAPKELKSDKINVATASWDVPFRAANFIYLWDKPYTLGGNIPRIDFLNNFKRDINGETTFEIDNSFPCSDKKVIYYTENDGYYEGHVCFENNDRSKFFGEAMMIGAIFIDTKEDFDCVKNLAVDRLEIVNDLYKEKANELIKSGSCTVSGYNSAVHYDEDVNNFDENFNFNKVSLVEDANNDLISEGCASVY